MAQVSGVHEAVQECGGSPTTLAAAVGGKVVRQHVEYWLRIGKVPAEHVPAVHKAANGKVSYERLNPDVDWAYVANTAAAA